MCPTPTKKGTTMHVNGATTMHVNEQLPCMSMKQRVVTITRYDLYNSSPLMSIHKDIKDASKPKINSMVLINKHHLSMIY